MRNTTNYTKQCPTWAKMPFTLNSLKAIRAKQEGELLKKEGEKIREYQSKLNKIVSGRIWKTYFDDNRQKYKSIKGSITKVTKTKLKKQNRTITKHISKKWQNETANTTKTTRNNFYSKKIQPK